MNASRTRITVAALPSALMLALYYSLAIHIHHSLGKWPTSIGERGFPSALATHCMIAVKFYSALILSLCALPIPILVCLLIERWRRFGRGLAVFLVTYAGFLILCCMLMQIAPAGFLYWWWD